VSELEAASNSRVLLLDDGAGATWRPRGETQLDAGVELVVVIPRGELGRVLAWTETDVHATPDPSPS
jgi:hypothetical protein